jgi:N-acetylmuramoyl-L-alanine amidase
MKNKALKSFIYGLSSLVFIIITNSFTVDDHNKQDSTEVKHFRVKTIVVDAGHGGRATGAEGAYSLEKNVTLALAIKLQKAIEKDVPGVKAVMTRNKDEDVGFQERSDIANEHKGDLFISLHCNSLSDRISYSNGKKIRVPDKSGRGVLILVYTYRRVKEEEAALRENLFEEKEAKVTHTATTDASNPTQQILINAIKDKYRHNSILFGDLVNAEFTDGDGRPSDGVKEQSIHVLCNSAMPAVLIETGFINNPKDEEYLNSEDGQNEIVNSIVRAIISYKKELEHPNP